MRAMNDPAAFSEPLRFHPLELIPFFRRFPCSRSRNLVYTLIWNVLLGGVFLLVNAGMSGRVPGPRVIWLYFVIANFIGFAIHALYEGGVILGLERWARCHGVAAKALYFTAIPILGVIAGFQAADWIVGIGFGNWMVAPGWIVSIAATGVVVSVFCAVVFHLREREAHADAELARRKVEAERLERAAIAANLRALQAQIEPHFLFNTLANVASLVDREPARAKHMLERLNRFLRASLEATRTESTTLGAERELLAAYLDVLQVRMGERLRYDVAIEPGLEAFPIAPMLLQPVVENAIRHGLEPKVDGGSVQVAARRDAAYVVLEVRDTGAGFAPRDAAGVGLANLRERLRGLYGGRASLAIIENRPAGTVVSLRIPA